MLNIPGVSERTRLRDVPQDRTVYAAQIGTVNVCVRVLYPILSVGFDELVRSVALDGRGSTVGLPTAVVDVLEAYRLRARLGPLAWLPHVLRAGVLAAQPGARDGQVYIVTSWLDGQTLEEAAGAIVNTADQRALFCAIAQRLASLHAHQLAFGDLKPSNVIVSGPPIAHKVGFIDLDTLREMPSDTGRVQTTSLTQEYAAPEQRTSRETCLASDVYAFGETLARTAERARWQPTSAPWWRVAVDRCRSALPSDRPTATDLVTHLQTGTDLPTRTGPGWTTRVDEPSPTLYVPEPEDTEQPAPAAASVLAREVSFAAAEPRWPVAFEIPSSRAPTPPPARNARSTWFDIGLLTTIGLATAAGLFVSGLIVLGFVCASQRSTEQACQRLADLRPRLAAQKVDASKNNRTELLSIIDAATQDLSLCPDDAVGLGIQALARVWQQGWQNSGARMTPSVFEVLGPEVSSAAEKGEPEGLAARTAYASAGCRLLDTPATRDRWCQLSHESAIAYLGSNRGRAFGWLDVEVRWADAMAALGQVQREVKDDPAGASDRARGMLDRCLLTAADMAAAPVNGPEMAETCLHLAGFAEDYGRFFGIASTLIDAVSPAGGVDSRVLEKIYGSASRNCKGAKVGKDRLPSLKGARTGDGGWADWCRVAGAMAVGCGERTPIPSKSTCTCCYATGATDNCWEMDARSGLCSAGIPMGGEWCEAAKVTMVALPDVPWVPLLAAPPSRGLCRL